MKENTMSSFSLRDLSRAAGVALLLGTAGISLAGCNTVHGAGQDLSNAGTATGDAAHTAVKATSNAASTAATATGNAADSAGNAVAKTYNNTVN
jgi:predicted small secreted protein